MLLRAPSGLVDLAVVGRDCTVFALGSALVSAPVLAAEIKIKDVKVEQVNFDTYPVRRMERAPQVDTLVNVGSNNREAAIASCNQVLVFVAVPDFGPAHAPAAAAMPRFAIAGCHRPASTPPAPVHAPVRRPEKSPADGS
jgi:hypothetical protein